MPVRKIPKSYRAVTGRFPSKRNRGVVYYESKLERDFFLKLEFDNSVDSYEEQPVKIPGEVKGRDVVYTLDCKVNYRGNRRSLLAELKYQQELDDESEKLEIKLARATEYAAENQMDFDVFSEKDVNDEALKNYKRLYRYVRQPRDFESSKQPILKALSKGPMTIRCLLQSLGEDRTVQARYLPTFWHMLFIGEIETDLSVIINYESELRLKSG